MINENKSSGARGRAINASVNVNEFDRNGKREEKMLETRGFQRQR